MYIHLHNLLFFNGTLHFLLQEECMDLNQKIIAGGAYRRTVVSFLCFFFYVSVFQRFKFSLHNDFLVSCK